MKHTSQPGQENDELGRLLRGARPEPELPPGFQRAVWRRLEKLQSAGEWKGWSVPSILGWLERLVPQPRLALATISAMVVIGATLGVRQGLEQANLEAKARYVATVNPAPIR